MRLAARVLLPGTGWVAFVELMDLVCLMMGLSGKRFLPRGSLAFFDFHTMKAVCEATISFRVQRPAFSRTDFEDCVVRATDLINRLMFSVARFAARKLCTNLKGIAAGTAARIFPMTRPFANRLRRFEGTPYFQNGYFFKIL